MMIMNMRTLLIATSFFMLSGCVTGYTLVEPGSRAIGGKLIVNASAGWNQAPSYVANGSRKGAQTWTHDGLLLDRLVFIPSIPDGETLLISRDKAAALPTFSKDMLPNEIEELVESSIVKYFGEGQAAVSTSNLRPHKFGEQRGFMFDLEAVVTDSPQYKGVVGAFIADDELYIMWYICAMPFYFDKHLADAESIIRGASLADMSG
jgi:hypothetical protein